MTRALLFALFLAQAIGIIGGFAAGLASVHALVQMAEESRIDRDRWERHDALMAEIGQ